MIVFVNQYKLGFLLEENRMSLFKCWEWNNWEFGGFADCSDVKGPNSADMCPCLFVRQGRALWRGETGDADRNTSWEPWTSSYVLGPGNLQLPWRGLSAPWPGLSLPAGEPIGVYTNSEKWIRRACHSSHTTGEIILQCLMVPYPSLSVREISDVFLRVSQAWHYWHVSQIVLFCWGLSCVLWDVQQHHWPLPSRCQEHIPTHPSPTVQTPKVSADVAECPLGDRIIPSWELWN